MTAGAYAAALQKANDGIVNSCDKLAILLGLDVRFSPSTRRDEIRHLHNAMNINEMLKVIVDKVEHEASRPKSVVAEKKK